MEKIRYLIHLLSIIVMLKSPLLPWFFCFCFVLFCFVLFCFCFSLIVCTSDGNLLGGVWFGESTNLS